MNAIFGFFIGIIGAVLLLTLPTHENNLKNPTPLLTLTAGMGFVFTYATIVSIIKGKIYTAGTEIDKKENPISFATCQLLIAAGASAGLISALLFTIEIYGK